MVDIKIYAVHERDNFIIPCVKKIGITMDDVYYDDRPNGGKALYTAKKAWLSSVPEGVTHRLIMPDDIYVCEGFKEIIERIVVAHPDKMISLFPYQYRDWNVKIERNESPYVRMGCCGMGIIMPVQYIKPCFDYIEEKYKDNIDDDAGMYMWAAYAGFEMISTVPSTVQHIGDDSILTPGMHIRRTIHFSEHPVADWDSRYIMEPKELKAKIVQ